MGYWMKLYTDILDDEKVMCEISDAGQLGMFFVFLVAKKLDNPNVGSLQSLSFHSRKPIQFWQEAMPELVKSGIVIEENGSYIVKNFEKRQSAIDSTERSRQSRKNKNDESQTQRSCNDTATIRHGEKRREEKEIEAEEEIEAEKEKDTSSPKQKFIQKFIQVIPHQFIKTDQPERLLDLVADYGENKVLEVARWASQDSRSMEHAIRSITGAIRNWQSKESDNNDSVFEEWINGKKGNSDEAAAKVEQAPSAVQTDTGNA